MGEAVCATDDIPDKSGRVFEVAGRKLALFRIGPEVFALDHLCPHYGADLCDGRVSAKLIEVACPWHGMRFDLKTGLCATYDRLGVATYPVEIRDGTVFVDPTQPRRAAKNG